jgi:hypothetical protein
MSEALEALDARRKAVYHNHTGELLFIPKDAEPATYDCHEKQPAVLPDEVPASLKPLWERFYALREFVLRASHGDTIAGATAALDRFDEIERKVLDARSKT